MVDDYKAPEAGPDFTEGQEGRILYLHGPFARGIQRFKRWVGVALVILALGNGAALKLVTLQRAEACQARNTQINQANVAQDRSRTFLKGVASAMHADGDDKTAMALDEYIAQTENQDRLSPIKC